MIRVNNRVKWTSQAGGSYRKKTGTVVARVQTNQDPNQVVQRLSKKHDFKINKAFGAPRDHFSFMVLVPGETENQKPTLYWPRVEDLQVA